jgi:hypothetical protein
LHLYSFKRCRPDEIRALTFYLFWQPGGQE